MGYLHDFRALIGALLDEHAPKLDSETRKQVLAVTSEKVLESYRNGLAEGRAKKGGKRAEKG